MKYPTPKHPAKVLALLMALALPSYLEAANISLTASDASPNNSMNSAGKWSTDSNGYGPFAPQATNDYFTGPFFVRTPNGTSAGITFAGHSLTLQDVSGNPGTGGQGAPFRSILYKGAGGETITINNLTNAAGSVINQGGAGNVTVTFTGNLWTIAGNTTIISDQGPTIIGYPIYGSYDLTNHGSVQSGVHAITYTGSLAAFTGRLILYNLNGGMTVNLNAGSSSPGNPSTFTPDQITLGLGATLIDNVGITFNNANAGFTLTGNANINAASATVIAEPITDATNGPSGYVSSGSALTCNGAGTLTLSSANNTYSGGTVISSGVLAMGVNNALTNNANVTDNGTLDLNSHSVTINNLTGTGTVDTLAGGTPTLTVGSAGGSATLSGTVQNSAGTLSVTKVGAGTETFSGAYLVSGTTTVAGGTLNLTTASGTASIPGGFVVSNGATMTANTSLGTPLAATSVLVGTNSTLSINVSSTANGVNATSLTFQDNATNIFSYGTVTANPGFPAINVAGGISVQGTNIVLNIAATGLKTGTFSLIKYTGPTLASIANFQLSPPPGVAAILLNNPGSLDIQITSIPNVLAWNGVNGTAWDLGTANWSNTVSGAITVFQQYTNNGVVAGDAVTFDDTLTNDLVNPQPTNIVLNSRFAAFPVIFNSILPYTIAGSGGITGVTSLTISNTGSLTLLTSNSFTGGVNIAGGSLIITNDSALGAVSGGLTINGTTLQINGSLTNTRAVAVPAVATIGVGSGFTAGLGGRITGGAASVNKTDVGTLLLAARETFTGDLFIHNGTVILDQGGSITNGSYHDVGQNNTDNATFTMRGNAAFSTTSDFNMGDLDSSVGTFNLQNSATVVVNAIYVGSANAAGSTASGVVNQSGGTLTEISTAVGSFSIGGRTSLQGVGTYNMSGGNITANAGIRVGGSGAGTLNQSGGTIVALAGINIARLPGSFGTNNLNGGTLATLNVASSTGTNAVFNFNGGTLSATNPTAPWFASTIVANVRANGAIVDSANNNVTIAAPLLAGSPAGGLTKKGAGTLTLSGTNTFTGPITNNAGTLSLNTASTYAGATVVNAGAVQLTTASALSGGATVANGGLLTVNQVGSGTETMGALTLNGAASAPGATLALAPTIANNPAVALVSCTTLTLSGTNTISLPISSVGSIALIHYTTLAIAPTGGNITNLSLPQGAAGYITNIASTIFAVITSSGPGIVWTGTNNTAAGTNVWNINNTVNWLLGSTPTTYRQVVIPGDLVTFNDSGSGTVLLSNNVGPTSLTISNNAKSYTFSGPGNISGPTGILKLGTGTATLNLATNNYTGTTVISNGTLVVGTSTALSPNADLVVGTPATLQLLGRSITVGELTGGGIIDNNSGINPQLTVGTSVGGTWNGTIQDHNAGGASLNKVGSGTWVVGGTNSFNSGQPFSDLNQVNGGTVVITNGGVIQMASLQFEIANGGNVAGVVVAGGTLAVNNNVLSVGYSTNALGVFSTGSLTVNSGTVIHAGTGAGFAAVANSIDVGAQGATGTLTVNGGQVLNNSPLFLGDNGGSGTLQLNGGVVQARQITANGTPNFSTAYLNGGTLLAATNIGDFITSSTSPLIQSRGFSLDDGGFAVTMSSQAFSEDPLFPGGGMTKKGAGTLYLDSVSTYPGTTVVTNGTLAGVGGVSGPVIVAPTGTLGAGNAGGIGTGFSILNNNNLTIQGNAALRITKDFGTDAEDQVIVSGNVTYGGTLIVTNVTADANVLTTSDSFLLFNVTGTKTGNFTSIVGSPGAGLAYQFTPSSGILSIIVQTISPTPVPVTFTVNGNTLQIGWPEDHRGWFLQAQTNTLAAGLLNNWFDIPGSDANTNAIITINPAMPDVFYRLRHP